VSRSSTSASPAAGGPGTRSPFELTEPGTVAAPTGRTYGGSMTEEEVDASEPDIMDIYDVVTDLALVCRVCGSLVASSGAYPRAHWDWHEASNGA
jgi:hypothetical protein